MRRQMNYVYYLEMVIICITGLYYELQITVLRATDYRNMFKLDETRTNADDEKADVFSKYFCGVF